MIKVYTHALHSGIRPSKEFAKKGLAAFAVNVGLKCSHGCTYCSSGSLLRCHEAFRRIGRSPFDGDYAIVDPDMPDKVAHDAARMKRRGMVQLCTTVDAWAPEAKKYELGRRCLEAILSQPGWSVRILTKNASVAEDFDLIERYRDRVLVGLSITGSPDCEAQIAVVEPRASSLAERMRAMKEAHDRGFRTYGMLCPLLPGIGNSAPRVTEMMRFVDACGAEEVFAEAVNPRGPGLKKTEEALRAAGLAAEADAIAAIRHRDAWSGYVREVIQTTQHSMQTLRMLDRLKFLLYPSGLLAKDVEVIRRSERGIVWL